MNKLTAEIPKSFSHLVQEIPHIGFKYHAARLLDSANKNLPFIQRTINDLSPLEGPKAQSGIIISAGPSVHRRQSIKRIKESQYPGTVIAVDGSYIACLKAGLIPEFVVTLDPHPTRVVRWFGDPEFEKNKENDDYFARQDLDIAFRRDSVEENQENIKLVNRDGCLSRAIVSASAAENVVKRLMEARFDSYWWNPLVDNPRDPTSLTRQMYELNRLPCMNTGGTVGNAAWVFASTRLKIPRIALVGMAFGYYGDTPYQHTQTYYELLERLGSKDVVEEFFIENTFPLTGQKFYTDPTYFWYRSNLLELLDQVTGVETYNCTEGGTLVDERVPCLSLDEFLFKESSL